MSRTLRTASSLLVLSLGVMLAASHASGFTQSGVAIDFIGSGIPMGHEWITRLAALEVLGSDPVVPPDPNDPRRGWGPKGRAKNPSITSPAARAEAARIRSRIYRDDIRYASVYKLIFDAIVGERWVDTGGFNVAKARMDIYNCFDDVAQEAVDVQYDHFMRRFDDRDSGGGVRAAAQSRQRFIEYFVTAATADNRAMRVWDGGGFAAQVDVDRNYFLFGRAIHLFQDSFSAEHTVRIQEDMYESVREVKSYLCASGSEQHSHAIADVFSYKSGDVIWIPGTQLTSSWLSYRPSYMKTNALVATEATKDLWAAFIRTMGLPEGQRAQAARAEANQLASTWLGSNDAAMRAWYSNENHRDQTYVLATGQTGRGQAVGPCVIALGTPSGNPNDRAAAIAETQRICLFNVRPIAGYGDVHDPVMRMPFNWEWTNYTWQIPRPNWQIPNPPADVGRRVQIRSRQNGCIVTVPDGLKTDSLLRCRAGAQRLELIAVPWGSDLFFRATYEPGLFLSYNLTPGDAKLWNGVTDSNFRVEPVSGSWAIFNPRWNNYFWLNGDTIRLNSSGKKENQNAHWDIDGLPR